MGEARIADLDDAAQLTELARAAIEEKRGQRGGDIWWAREARCEPIDQTFVSAIGDRDHLVVVGEYAGGSIGYGVVRLETLHDGRLLGVIDDLFVLPEGRAVGVGEAMMDEILRWCTSRGCYGVDSVAMPGDRATKNFFEANGLVARAIVVHRRLTHTEDDA